MPRRIAFAVLVLLTACSQEAAAPPRATTTSTSTSTTTTVTTTTSTTVAKAGCPVSEDQLARLSIEYWGFDDQQHTGILVVSKRVGAGVQRVFATLLRERFPIRRIEPIEVYGGDDERSLEADNTAGYNCRYVVGPGPKRWSSHAYGKAIDVNPVENPYLEGGRIHPKAGAEYTDRSTYRPGMAVEGGVLVKAFAAEGWQWGGRWRGTPDYQHFFIS